MSETIIIVGGTGGIGSALARKVAARGQSPHLIGRKTDQLASLASELDGTWSEADVTDVQALTSAVQEASGPVAGLAYCVGTINLKPLARLNADEFARDFSINAQGAAIAIQAALPALKVYDGICSIVLFSSVAVAQGFSGHASISMAKGAVEGLTVALAAELAPKIRVNAIAPSLTATPLAEALTSNEAMAKSIAQLHALGRLGTAEDSAAAADFLLSDQSGWITGQILRVDGGRSSLRTNG
ncbi:short-chain dehydrogenase [Devosia soli]|uniref:Short-chain dehydrogenase n=1 Tax=Devosia soli TaxID=361041 RepID=A0A0F5LCT0_9HYPH|nr:SDR family oxidoreductase [Devosia soli]KKB80153.1 short-chain dehydrogenase [Devosia soli]